MEQHVCDTYVRILKNELIVALGCTEPIAIAYAGALARKVLGAMPQKVNVACSGNIVKNVKGEMCIRDRAKTAPLDKQMLATLQNITVHPPFQNNGMALCHKSMLIISRPEILFKRGFDMFCMAAALH